MNKMFTQPTGPVAKQVNKQAIARILNIKQKLVGILNTHTPVDSYTVLYDPNTELYWANTEATGTPLSWVVTDPSNKTINLVTSAGSYTLKRTSAEDEVFNALASSTALELIGLGQSTLATSNLPVSPKVTGGIPGDSSVDNSTAINEALTQYKNVDLGGEVWYIASPIYIPSNTRIANGKIVSTAAKDGSFMSGSIFAPGNYHPAYLDNVTKVAITAALNSNIITLDSTTGYAAGDLVRIVSTEGITNGSDGFIPMYMQLAKVISVTATTLILDSVIESTLTLTVHPANGTGVSGRNNIELFVCEGSLIENIEVDTWDYWIADSATYNCVFRNIHGKSKSVVYGNTYCRTLFENISIAFRNKGCELACGSHDTVLRNINFIADTSDWLSTSALGISLAESGRNILFDNFNINLSATSTPSVVVRVSSHQNIEFKKGRIRGVTSTNNILSVEHYGGNRLACKNIKFSDIQIQITGAAAVILDVYKSADDSVIENVEFENIYYSGVTPSVSIIRQRGTENNWITGVKGSVTTDIAGSYNVSYASGYDFKLYGPFTLSSAMALDSMGKIQLISPLRVSAKELNYSTSAISQITSTDTTNRILTRTYPAGSLRSSDTVDIVMAASFAQGSGTKSLSFSVMGSSGEVASTISALATEDGTATFNLKMYVVSDVYVLIIGTSTKLNTTTPIRMLVPVASLAANDLVLHLSGYKTSSSDGLSVQKIHVKLNDVTN